jgi:hypothetical protein
MKNKALAAQSIQEVTENLAKWRQLPGRPPTSYPRIRAVGVGMLTRWTLPLLMACVGCGGGSRFHNVTVNIAPVAPTFPPAAKQHCKSLKKPQSSR